MKKIVILPPLFLPPAEYFCRMRDSDIVVIDVEMRYNKRRKEVHRAKVSASGSDCAFITVPVSTPVSSKCGWNDVLISAHGEWWRVMRSTLATNYGGTPFFELLRDEFFRYIDASAVGKSIVDFNISLMLTVRRICGIFTPLTVVVDRRFYNDKDVEIIDLHEYDFYAEKYSRSVIETIFEEGRI